MLTTDDVSHATSFLITQHVLYQTYRSSGKRKKLKSGRLSLLLLQLIAAQWLPVYRLRFSSIIY